MRLIIGLISTTLFAVFVILLYLQTMKGPLTTPFKNAETSSLPKEFNNGAWIWESPSKIDEAKFTESISFAKTKNIKTIYLFIEECVYISENSKYTPTQKQEKILEYQNKLRSLISIANKQDIVVEALAGDTNWAEPSHEYLALEIIDCVIDFNNNEWEEKLTGVQFDIEYYNQDDYKGNEEIYSKNYLTLASKIATEVKKTDLKLGFAIPYWLHRDGTFEKLLTILKDTTDAYVVLMSYRNTPYGDNGTVAISEKSFDIAEKNSSNVKIYIGQETIKNKVKSITYFEKYEEELHEASTEIAEKLSKYKNFAGIAIHTLDGYMGLKE